jgi:hypothetical protein
MDFFEANFFYVIPAQAGTQAGTLEFDPPLPRFSLFFFIHSPLGPRFRGDDELRVCLGMLKILLGNGYKDRTMP